MILLWDRGGRGRRGGRGGKHAAGDAGDDETAAERGRGACMRVHEAREVVDEKL